MFKRCHIINHNCSKLLTMFIFTKYKHKWNGIFNCTDPKSCVDVLRFHTYSPRYFQITQDHKAKVYTSSENIYAYNVLQSIPLPKVDVFVTKSVNEAVSTLQDFENLLNRDWKLKTASEIVQGFNDALKYCLENNISVSDVRFDRIVDGLMDKIELLTDGELSRLFTLIQQYPPTDSYNSHNFHDIWSALDDICCWRMVNWTTEQVFHFADHWYHLHLGKLCNYTVELVDKLSKHPENLTKAQLVHAFFYLNVCRKKHVDFNFTAELEKRIHEMRADEMAIAALGYFKSQSPLKSRFILYSMIKQIKDEVKSIHEISLCALLKLLRYSPYPPLMDQLMDVLESLSCEVDRLSNFCCLHIALLGTTLQFLHEKSLTKVTNKLVKSIPEPSEMRLKDLERLLLPLTMFNFDSKTDPDVYKVAYEEIHKDIRRKEMVKHPRCLPSALHYLSIQNMYSHELMDKVLEREFITESYGKSPRLLPRELFSLDSCIDIECPGYSGNRLSKQMRHRAAKWLAEYTPTWDQHKKLTAANKLILNVIETVTKIVGHEKFRRIEHVLPHFSRADIIVCKNKKTGDFVEPLGYDQYVLGDIMKPQLNDDLQWFAIVVVGWNNTIRNTFKPLGIINMKRRQLKSIGYEPLLVIWNEYASLEPDQKALYLLNKLNKPKVT